MSWLAVACAADAAPKGNLLIGLGVFFLLAFVASCVGLGFLLRWLHRHAPAWWRWLAIVWTWILLAGCVLAVVQLAYAFATGEVMLE